MKNYKVILHLMKDPNESDATFKQEYNVTAEKESEAYRKAEKAQSEDVEEVRHRCIFNYDIIEIK